MGKIILLSILAPLAALSTDVYLPSVPSMMDVFGESQEWIQLTLSAFIFAFGAAQIFIGPLSDRFGRVPVLMGGMSLYGISSLLCVFAPHITILIVGRIFQAVGAASGQVMAHAIVRDSYHPDEAPKIYSWVAMGATITPIVAPIIGGVLHEHWGWKSSFYFLFFASIVILVLIKFILKETLPAPIGINFKSVLINYRSLLKKPTYIAFAIINAFAFSGLFLFVSSSSFIYIKLFQFTPNHFGLMFAINALFFLLGGFFVSLFSKRRTFSLFAGVSLMLIGGSWMALGFFKNYWMSFTIPMGIATAGFAILLPIALAGALKPFPEKAGTAAAFLGFVRFAVAAALSLFWQATFGNSPQSIGCGLVVSGLFVALGIAIELKSQHQIKHQLATL